MFQLAYPTKPDLIFIWAKANTRAKIYVCICVRRTKIGIRYLPENAPKLNPTFDQISIKLRELIDWENLSVENFSVDHQGEFSIGLYLKVIDSTKSLVTFLVLVRGIFFLYHLKAYVYSFILSSGF